VLLEEWHFQTGGHFIIAVSTEAICIGCYYKKAYCTYIDTFFVCLFAAATCPANLEYQQCGSICPQVCDFYNETCISGCAEGCFCPVGQMMDGKGNCVQPTPCPG